MIHALILHNMGDPVGWREAIADFQLALPRYAEDMRCLVHDAALPVPNFVREYPFDLVVINSTVLGAVTNVRTFTAARAKFAFLARSPAYKVALRQDDYYCSEETDRLMVDWGVDTVHTVCPDHWDVLYPRYLARGGDIRLGYTGYVTPRMRRLAALVRPRDARTNDVVYRASGRPGFPNEMALVKARLGQQFLSRYEREDWRLDITTDNARVIKGDAWWRFLADSRVTLGSNSGSSLLIRNLDVACKIRNYQKANPTAAPEQVIEACVPAADRAFSFTAISPRVLEAALVETTQLLVPGPYSGFIEVGEHYWPLAEDCSNRDEVLRIMRDRTLQQAIADRCKEVVLSTPDLQIETFIDTLAGYVADRSRTTSERGFDELESRYRNEKRVDARRHHRQRRVQRVIAIDIRRQRAREPVGIGMRARLSGWLSAIKSLLHPGGRAT